MPVHFSSICISLTYDTLPSPNSLTWSLCNEDISTVSHILAVFKVALSQGRFTFHHANIVRIIITNIRSFIKNIKSTVPTLKQLIKRKYVKKGSRVKKQKFLSQWDLASGVRLGLSRRSRWRAFFSTSHSIY